MYQTGDLLWIPAGTLLKRPRIPGKDDLFSNFYQTKEPCIALFVNHESHEECTIMLEGESWSVETKSVRHNVQDELCLLN